MKSAFALLFTLISAVSLSAQVFITSFGSDDFTDIYDSLSQTTSAGQFTTDDLLSALLSGDFAPVDISGDTGALALTATVTENPETGFQISLFDGENSYVYEGNWADFTTGEESTAILTAMSDQTDLFDFTQVQGLDFHFDAGLGTSLDVTLNTLSAVPEPSTYAALAGLVCLGFVMIRRRRRGA